ncbi:MAG TPA: hypothetical protein VGR09_15580 [Gemmatimonadales bacterium]|nr:hypothetical protein [Gemmatimonadales bacterium]
MLYLPSSADELACRRCHDLRYASENMTRRSRLERRSRRLYRQAGSAELGAAFTRKPHRMTWRRFHRLMDEAESLDREAAGMASLPRRLADRLR